MVAQLDAIAAEQDHLVALVVQFRETPMPDSVMQDSETQDSDLDMNQNLFHLIRVWLDFEHDAPVHPRLDDRPGFREYAPNRRPWRQTLWRYMPVRDWGKVSAFMARLHTAAPDVLKLDVRGLWAMIEALEQPRSPSQLEDVQPTAAYWIIYAGNELCNNDNPYVNGG